MEKQGHSGILFRCFKEHTKKLGWTFAPEHAIISFVNAGIVHRLVYQPSKLRRWVRFPLPAPSKRDANSSRVDVSFSVLVTLLGPVLIFRPSRQTAKQQAVPAKRSCLLLFFHSVRPRAANSLARPSSYTVGAMRSHSCFSRSEPLPMHTLIPAAWVICRSLSLSPKPMVSASVQPR